MKDGSEGKRVVCDRGEFEEAQELSTYLRVLGLVAVEESKLVAWERYEEERRNRGSGTGG